jgi:DNA polymerase-1
LSQYATLDDIYKHADEIPGALGNKVRCDKDNAFISQSLTHLYDDVPLGNIDIIFKPTYNESLLQLFDKLQLTANTKKLHLLWNQYKDN